MANPMLDLLSRVSLFQKLEQGQIERLLAIAHTRQVPENGYYFQQEDPANWIFVLTEGRVKISQVTAEGQLVTMRNIQPGQMFGGLAIINPGSGYPGSAQAEIDSSALAWQGADFRRLAETNAALAVNMMDIMHAYIEEMQARFRELATERVEQRLARALLRLATQSGRRTEAGVTIELALTRQDLAELTGTTLYTASRVLSSWERQGIIRTGRERVTLSDPHGLVRIAEGLDQ